LVLASLEPVNTANCNGQGGVKIETGTDNGSGGFVGTPTASYVCNGSGGGSSLVLTSLEPANTANCNGLGGVKIETGTDNGSGGFVGTPTASYVCNGPMGFKGDPGLQTLVTTRAITGADLDAPGGCTGTRVDMGLDLNGINGLEADESTAHAYICDGAVGGAGFNALIVTGIEPPGDNCPFGGLKILSGQDTSGPASTPDGILDAFDSPVSNYVCNVGSVPLIQVLPDAPQYFRLVPMLGFSTWDRIAGFFSGWTTFGEETFFYDSYLFVNRTNAAQTVDVTAAWTPGLGGNLTVYTYPFNPLLPTLNAFAWFTCYGGAGGQDCGGLGDETLNLATLTLAPGEAKVIVASPDDPGYTTSPNLCRIIVCEIAPSAALVPLLPPPPYTLGMLSYTPVDTSALPATPVTTPGTVAVGKYHWFKAAGLTPGGSYRVALTGLTDDADLSVFNDVFGFGPSCFSAAGGTVSDACATTADAMGSLWIQAYGFASLLGSIAFNMNVEAPLPVVAAPLTVDDPATPSSVDATSSTYTAVAAGSTLYDVTLSNFFFTGSLTVTVSDDSGNSTPLVCTILDIDPSPATCYGFLTGDATTPTLTVTVDGTNVSNATSTVNGAFYDIQVVRAPMAVTGMALTAGAPATASSVDTGTSTYTVSSTGGPAMYSVLLSNLSPRGDVTVTLTDELATTPVICSGQSFDTAISCSFTTGVGATQLIITVDGSTTVHGTFYDIQVANVPVAENGVVLDAVGTVVSSSVDNTVSTYTAPISSLPQSYQVNLTSLTPRGDVTITVSDDGAGSTPTTCLIGLVSATTLGCSHVTGTGGTTLSISVSGSATVNGTFYGIAVVNNS
jgi:hypothetical protein